MGRPALYLKTTTVRLSQEMLDRIDSLVGTHQRAIFIRDAVEARLKTAEDLRKLAPKSE